MRGQVQMTVPEVAMVLGTRAALGIGAGLLLADSFASPGTRRAVGRTLLAAGAYAGVCLMSDLFGWGRPFRLSFGTGERTALRVPSEYWPHENEAGVAPVT